MHRKNEKSVDTKTDGPFYELSIEFQMFVTAERINAHSFMQIFSNKIEYNDF